ncbi:hypothetical protein E8E11_009032 [Didymella keratinophila]|nr:hypothetical protein E8E11_009032 [Didymella keratinophila]
MRTTIIPYAAVAADYKEVTEMQDTLDQTSRSQRFNTAHHKLADISPVIHEAINFKHEQPPWTAYGYVISQPLIAHSQGLRDSHVVQIPTFLMEDLMRCHAAWVTTNAFPPDLIKETVETWKSTKKGKDLTSLLDGEKKWFMRLEQMSPKDSPFGGKLPTTTFEDVVIKMCSSMRAWSSLQNERLDAQKEGRDDKIDLILNPWDPSMDGWGCEVIGLVLVWSRNGRCAFMSMVVARRKLRVFRKKSRVLKRR